VGPLANPIHGSHVIPKINPPEVFWINKVAFASVFAKKLIISCHRGYTIYVIIKNGGTPIIFWRVPFDSSPITSFLDPRVLDKPWDIAGS
jgi:hypothetical protein